jgi:hypothetical protein
VGTTNAADAYAATPVDGKDTSQLIGYIDVGRVIEGTFGADSILDSITIL